MAGVIHLHPVARCNLRCVHCYSASAPEREELVAPQVLVAFCRTVRTMGFDTVSVSGGEPTLYPHLQDLVMALVADGLKVNLVTNGLRRQPLEALQRAGWSGAVAISFDGLAQTHDSMRRREGAYARGLALLSWLRDRNFRVGASICVSRHSFPELPDLVETLIGAGAGFVQMHPLTAVGRARDTTDLSLLNGDLAALMVQAQLLSIQWPEVGMRADVAMRQHLLDGLVDRKARPYSTLVVDELGDVYPICYGIGAGFRLGSVSNFPVERVIMSDQVYRIMENAYSGPPFDVVDPYSLLIDHAAREPIASL